MVRVTGRALRPLGTVLGVALAVGGARPAYAEASFPQCKINAVDTTGAPRIKLYVSFLDRRLRPVNFDEFVRELSLLKVPEEGKPKPLFWMTGEEREVKIPTDKDAEEESEEAKAEKQQEAEKDAPTATLMGDEPGGLAAVVVMPGYSGTEYRDGLLGERQKTGASLFFKKLGKTNLMNVVWYTDEVYAFVYSRGRMNELTRLRSMDDKCVEWKRMQLEAEPEEETKEEGKEAEKKEEGPGENEAVCGLTDKYDGLKKIIENTAYSGFYPNLFGLGAPLCGKPEYPNTAPDENAKPAFETALEMLVRDAKPGQPKNLILLGDGRDGYIFRTQECKSSFADRCRKPKDGQKPSYREVKACMDELVKKLLVQEQKTFEAKLTRWIGLAKASGVRVHSVVNPNAEPHERERLEVLALRTGGTVRFADDPNQVVDLYTDLVDEITGQIVIAATDKEATPGKTVSYQVELGYLAGGSKGSCKTGFFATAVPGKHEGLTITIYESIALGEEKLGKWPFWLSVGAAALALLFLVFKTVQKSIQMIKGAGKEAKAAADKAKAAAGAAKGAAGAAAGAAKGAAAAAKGAAGAAAKGAVKGK
jgi:hypothetical protein